MTKKKHVKKFVAVVFGSSGEFEDYRRWPVLAFADEGFAHRYAQELTTTAIFLRGMFFAKIEKLDSVEDYDRIERLLKRLQKRHADPAYALRDEPSYAVQKVELING